MSGNYGDTILIFKWAGNVMPGLIQEMSKMGWTELKEERMGAGRYFVKEIEGRQIRISVLPGERGGPDEKNATTCVYFRILPEGKMQGMNSLGKLCGESFSICLCSQKLNRPNRVCRGFGPDYGFS